MWLFGQYDVQAFLQQILWLGTADLPGAWGRYASHVPMSILEGRSPTLSAVPGGLSPGHTIVPCAHLTIVTWVSWPDCFSLITQVITTVISPWDKTQIFPWTRQLLCGYHHFDHFFLKNNIFLFLSDFQLISKIKLSSMVVLMKCNCNNTRGYQFWLDVFISWKKKLKLR